MAFSAHRDVTYRTRGRVRTASYASGSVVCSGDPIVWSAVREPTEALEIYPEASLVAELGGDVSSAGWPVGECVVGRRDPVVLGVASTLLTAHLTETDLDETTTSTLAHVLVRHVAAE